MPISVAKAQDVAVGGRVTPEFGQILTQPAHALFRISSMGVDFLDLLTLIPVGFITAWTLDAAAGNHYRAAT